ncbi:uncharacterized protein EI97DRAFT_418866 [Westerdykella ornata]|uniref:U1-type domain-containing protein n=1 Tax=Westerdykella ornata TaxID=318751 RepID=A0A6A6JK71_WESOR|nr:uncharacterized protein EI97DRAFT_418866 [Westerdykella ornata]KAF2276096.1 hypothetical protein EI97DRAFT_418866 [Westerdykella ornata]
MAEYWKSTPKYWCKFCSVYVRDTKFERANHEATGRHQGNIQRSLRGIHREQEAEQRKKQQAKDEVARLNGIVSGASGASAAGSSTAKANDARAGGKPTFSRTGERQATLEDRKRQAAQLAAMGIAVPDQVRGELALAGEWQVVSQRVVDEDGEEVKSGLSTGVRKRKIDEEEQEHLAAAETITRKKGWGNTFKRLPGKSGEEDIEALFGGNKEDVKKEEGGDEGIKKEGEIKEEEGVKTEETHSGLQDIPTEEEAAQRTREAAAEPAAPAVVFKKRKKIAK